jgi:hypothetical protein
MRSFAVIWTATFLLAGNATAEPSEWRTADGRANIRIDDCAGVPGISWEKSGRSGFIIPIRPNMPPDPGLQFSWG